MCTIVRRTLVVGVQVAAAMEEFDTDSSGDLDFHEFVRMVCKSEAFKFKLSLEEKEAMLEMIASRAVAMREAEAVEVKTTLHSDANAPSFDLVVESIGSQDGRSELIQVLCGQSFSAGRKLYQALGNELRCAPLWDIEEDVIKAVHAGDCDTVTATFQAYGAVGQYWQEPNLKDDTGATMAENTTAPLMYIAARRGDDDMVTTLAGLGADVNAAKMDRESRKDTDKRATPAYIAAQQGHISTLQVLAGLNADLDLTTCGGFTPCFIAAQLGESETVQVLGKMGADVNKAANGNVTPTYVAAQNGNSSTIQVLVDLRADLDDAKQDGWTPTGVAAKNGHLDTVQLLAHSKADLNRAQHSHGYAPLHTAAFNNKTQMVRMLINMKADCNLKTKALRTPLDLAKTNLSHEAVAILADPCAAAAWASKYSRLPRGCLGSPGEADDVPGSPSTVGELPDLSDAESPMSPTLDTLQA